MFSLKWGFMHCFCDFGKKSWNKLFIFIFIYFYFYSKTNNQKMLKSQKSQLTCTYCLKIFKDPILLRISESTLPALVTTVETQFFLYTCLHLLHLILFSLTTSLSAKCSRQMTSSHGNPMGSFHIFEQYEHVNCNFNLSIFIEIFELFFIVFIFG